MAIRGETPQWFADTTFNLTGSPAVGNDGTVYFTDGGYLYALTGTNGLPTLAKSPWPMWRANPQHTGRVKVK